MVSDAVNDRDRVDKYCCFLHPRGDFTPRRLADPCPDCGRPFGFPLWSAPAGIRDFTVSGPIARGFYGATYEVTRGRLGRRFVLKVVPVEVYRFFGKDFERECLVHGEVSDGTDHLNDIIDFFDETLTFGDVTLDCHVAVRSTLRASPSTACSTKVASQPAALGSWLSTCSDYCKSSRTRVSTTTTSMSETSSSSRLVPTVDGRKRSMMRSDLWLSILAQSTTRARAAQGVQHWATCRLPRNNCSA
jgi:hypothetical protein